MCSNKTSNTTGAGSDKFESGSNPVKIVFMNYSHRFKEDIIKNCFCLYLKFLFIIEHYCIKKSFFTIIFPIFSKFSCLLRISLDFQEKFKI